MLTQYFRVNILCENFDAQELDEHTEHEDDSSNINDTSSEDEDDSGCSIVMSTSDDHSNCDSLDTSDLMKNYALMLEVPTTLTTTKEQI